MKVSKKETKEDHPFPNEELNLILKLNKEQKIPIEDISKLSNLIHKYLNLRAEVFHDF